MKRMKSTKLQAPSSREAPNFKSQAPRACSLEIGAWMFSGAWSLVLGALILSGGFACQASALPLDSAGGRFGFGANNRSEDFHQAEAFVDWNLPWQWRWGQDWRLDSRLDLSAGWLGDNSRSAAIFSSGPSLVVGYGNFPVSIEGGVSPTVISRYEFASRNLGIPFQFTSHAGFSWDFAQHLRFSYRFQHMSNAGLDKDNPGLNMNLLAISYTF
jgi:hypothetical protein